MNVQQRLGFFDGRAENRFWWFNSDPNKHLPLIFSALNDDDWATLTAWYDETDRLYPEGTGECNIPAMTFLLSLIDGNSLVRIVQCGHFIGFSTLMMGFMLRQMRAKSSLLSIDNDPAPTIYTQKWIDRAELGDFVRLEINTSAHPTLPALATKYLNGRPQMVFIDSSHAYQHTLDELNLWYPALEPGGFILLHDVSRFASGYNEEGSRGVNAAVLEWTGGRNVPHLFMNEFCGPEHTGQQFVYKDACGMGIIQKPLDPQPAKPMAAGAERTLSRV